MKTMRKKARLVCAIPAAVAMGAVMLYCLTAYVAEDRMFLCAVAAAVGVYLLMYLLVGRRISAKEAAKEEIKAAPSVSSSFAAPAARQVPAAPAPASPEKVPAGDWVDLRGELTGEEIRILLSDLQVASGKVPPEQKAALEALAGEISGSGSIHIKTLPVCVSAVEMGLGVFAAFGMAPAGHGALLEKLKQLQGAE